MTYSVQLALGNRLGWRLHNKVSIYHGNECEGTKKCPSIDSDIDLFKSVDVCLSQACKCVTGGRTTRYVISSAPDPRINSVYIPHMGHNLIVQPLRYVGVKPVLGG